jgi:hypothetical protein
MMSNRPEKDTTYYEVVEADSVDDTYPREPYRVCAHPSKDESWAMGAEDAACMWAERNHAYYDYPEEMNAIVTDPTGKKWRVTVAMEAVITASAVHTEELP